MLEESFEAFLNKRGKQQLVDDYNGGYLTDAQRLAADSELAILKEEHEATMPELADRKYTLKTLMLIRGLPSTGKTTLAKAIMSGYCIDPLGYVKPRCAHFEDEMFFNQLVGKGKEYADARLESESMCRGMTESAMKDNVNLIVVSNDFIRLWTMELYYKLGETYGYNVQEIICQNQCKESKTHTQENIARLARFFQIRHPRFALREQYNAK